MSSATDWPAQQIEQAIAPDLPGIHFEVLAQIDSSNSELMRRARDGQTQPVLLLAEHQSAGRGRLGRQWSSDFSFSLGLPLAPDDWSGLSLAVGLSIVQSLHPDLRLKWPNDVWWQGRKLAGILIETAGFGSGRYVVVGVGINIRPPEDTGLATAPAWLQELRPDMDRVQALLKIAAPLVKAIKIFEQHGFAPFQAEFNRLDALRNVSVTLSNGTVGIAQGVDRCGALQLETAQGLIAVTSAEVSVRPLGASSGAAS
ncbi:MAG: biotin--[acetyl-CoA-carboxylase] ligase [Rhodoferax sp.]|jgi:BirA family biotin operon repressor/biotin-[acetyl-CoA-carboxylase] ligase|nr:biotin--[acetyl-CoA-carboxylase] ligase [Rhodoferax sp.]